MCRGEVKEGGGDECVYLLGDEKIIIIIYNFCIALFSGVHKLTALCNILPSATRWPKKKKKKSPAGN